MFHPQEPMPLIGALQTLLRLTKASFKSSTTIDISVLTGELAGLVFVPNGKHCRVTLYCSVINPTEVYFTSNVLCNGSVTVLLYQLYKCGLISSFVYASLVRICDNEKTVN